MNTIKKETKAILLLIAITYLVFASLRPMEDDEAGYILAGKAILVGELNPLVPQYTRNYSNPFMYFMGSPLVPLAYGLAYLVGGLFLSRLIALAAVFMSLILLYRMNKDLVVLAVVGLSSSAILLASDSYLDSVALLLMVLSIYSEKREFASGLFFGLAAISKFILLAPLLIMFLRLKKRFILGALAVLIPFFILYWRLFGYLAEFIFISKLGQGRDLFMFLDFVKLYLPLMLFWYLGKPRKIIETLPIFSIVAYQLITLDFISWPRHLPDIEFSFARLVKPSMLLLVFVPIGMISAAINMAAYPSFEERLLDQVGGKVLTVNPNAYILLKGLPLKASAVNVSDYYYFDFNKDGQSEMDEYSMALRRGYFDFALISRKDNSLYPRYEQIQAMVEEHYCLLERGKKGVDIYVPCEK